jgi:hypothetical protein
LALVSCCFKIWKSWSGGTKVFSSPTQLQDALLSTGYIVDSVSVSTLFVAAKMRKPLLLEGPAGSGKTQLAYALAAATGTKVERLQCFEGLNEEKAIGRFDPSLQQLCIQLKAQSNTPDWHLLQSELHGREFFVAGPLLRALEYQKACVLLIDEIDKVGPPFEAQSFKRAAACLGLGRYLYYFAGVWVDLDERKRPRTVPRLPDWATPAGWIRGLRPSLRGHGSTENSETIQAPSNQQMVGEIEALAQTLGRGLYRGVLRDLAKVWNPREIQEVATQKKVLEYMHAAERGLERLGTALERTGHEALIPILDSMGFKSLERVDRLEDLKKIVLAIEELAANSGSNS